MACAGAVSFKFLTYQLPTVGYWPTVAIGPQFYFVGF